MSNKLISVIVPVYNVEKYLERCVNSIISQRYTDLEIILVNDGSTDKSGEISEELAKKDDRIKVYHKNNGGLSDARNYGVSKASGSYIGFVDSDDYIDENMYYKLYQVIEKEQADVAECGVKRVYQNKIQQHYLGEDYCLTTDSKGFLKEFLTMDKIYGSAWCKLIKGEIAKTIEFPVGKYYEDVYYNYELIKSANKYVLFNDANYYYYIRQGSITTQKFNPKHLDLLEGIEKIISYANENYVEFKDFAKIRQVYAYLSIFSHMIFESNYKKIPKYKLVKDFLVTNWKEVVSNKKAPTSLKIAMTLVKINEKLYKLALRRYRKKSVVNI